MTKKNNCVSTNNHLDGSGKSLQTFIGIPFPSAPHPQRYPMASVKAQVEHKKLSLQFYSHLDLEIMVTMYGETWETRLQ